MPRTRLYREGVLVSEGFPVADISDRIAEPSTLIWLDVCDPTAEDLAAISEELGLHPLAVDDAIHEHQRPKLDRYDTHLFVTAYTTSLDVVSGQLTQHKVSAFITPTALVTVHAGDGIDIAELAARWDRSSDLARYGVAFLVHGLLDYVVDTHFETVQALDTEMEGLEDEVFDQAATDATIHRRTFELRKSLVALRRVALPMREVANSLLRRDLDVVDPAIQPYFQDLYDHCLRVAEWTESLRDLVSAVFETYLTVRSNQINVIMKQVTSWAAIIAVPTAITGFYGQNIPYPGFAEPIGFWTSTVVTLTASVGLWALLRRRGWV